MMIEVDNMSDAVQMAQRLSEKEILYYCHLLVLVSIYLKYEDRGKQFKQAVKIYRKV
jgi:UDP-N-acetylmuramoylalanine--D-glutamate ligase